MKSSSIEEEEFRKELVRQKLKHLSNGFKNSFEYNAKRGRIL